MLDTGEHNNELKSKRWTNDKLWWFNTHSTIWSLTANHQPSPIWAIMCLVGHLSIINQCAFAGMVHFEQVIFDHRLVMTLTSDLLTSKSTQFIFVPNCIQVVNMAKFSQANL